jgi:hypothetical protein
MSMHHFTLVLDRQPTGAEIDALFEAGCDDASFEYGPAQSIGDFDREAPSLAAAIASAIRDIESVGFTVVGVVDYDMWTLGDVADRIGRSREAVRRYATGARGPGGFPQPVNPGREGTTFYRWSEVAPWLRDKLGLDIPDTDPALVVANLLLQARQHRDRVANMSALTELLVA